MKQLRLIFCLLFSPLMARAVTWTVASSGPSNVGSTWVGGSAPTNTPGNADEIDIPGDLNLTVPTGQAMYCKFLRIGSTTNSSSISTLTINGTVDMTVGGWFQGGNAANADGQLVGGPGGLLKCPTEFDWNCFKFRTTSTKASPFRITGACTVELGYVTGAKVDINVSNFVCEITGVITIYPGNTVGANASELVFDHCVFSMFNGMRLGSDSITPSTCPITFTNCDCISDPSVTTQAVILNRVAGSTSNLLIQHCTFRMLTILPPNFLNLITGGTQGWVVEDCVFYNAAYESDAPGGVAVTRNIIAAASRTPCTLDGTNASSMTYCYIPTIYDNGGGLNEANTAGAGIVDCGYNIMDAIVNGTTFTQRPDFFVPAVPMSTNYHNNLVIGTGEQCIGIEPSETWGTLNEKNNTTAMTVANTIDGDSNIFFQESGGPSTGTINIANNLYRGNNGAALIAIKGTPQSGGLGTQHVAYSDYNRFFHATFPYLASSELTVDSGNTAKTVPGSHDAILDPVFVDETRTLNTWYVRVAGGSSNPDDVTNPLYLFLTLNGLQGIAGSYNQNGSVCAWQPVDPRNWVADGFASSRIEDRAAGDPSDGSPDIGAVPVVTKCPIGFF